MTRIAFLCSGGGGNLRFISEATGRGLLRDAMICGVVVDRECAAGLFAAQAGIPVARCSFRQEDDGDLEQVLAGMQPDIIISNVHKILSPGIVGRFDGRIINLHYSLLPSFGGLIGANAVQHALDYGARLVGATVHFVNANLDAGRPIVQAAFPATGEEDAGKLMDTMFRVGCIALLSGIDIARRGRCGATPIGDGVLHISGRTVLFSPPVQPQQQFTDEPFWQGLK